MRLVAHFSLKVLISVHLGNALVAVFDHELKSVLVQLFQKSQDGAQNVLIASVRMVVAA